MKGQQVPCGDESQEISSTVLLPPDEAALFRSMVGSGIYLPQERIELGYVIKHAVGIRYEQPNLWPLAGDEEIGHLP